MANCRRLRRPARGGFGTLDELAEVLAWAQLHIHAKPIGLLDVDDYFGPLLAFFDRAAADGFLRTEHRGLLVSLASWRAPRPARLRPRPSRAGGGQRRGRPRQVPRRQGR